MKEAPTLSGSWEGTIHGTNTGRLYIHFEQSGEQVEGILEVHDRMVGVYAYRATGTIKSPQAMSSSKADKTQGTRLVH